MKQRKLTQRQVKFVLNNLDFDEPSYGGRMIAEKNFGKLNLRVVYICESNDIVDVTAHWADKRTK